MSAIALPKTTEGLKNLGRLQDIPMVRQLLTLGVTAAAIALGLWLFFWTGVGNASTFQMIPGLMRLETARLMPNSPAGERLKAAELESAAIIGFASAIGAYGGFFIPLGFATSMGAFGGPTVALYIFMTFYATCLVMNWVFYARPNSILNKLEKKVA